MIHEFSVSNYFSIYEETVLDLRIPGTAPDLPRFRRSKAKPDVRLPTVAVIMGPNGSGKTTLLRALVDVMLMRIASAPSLSTAEAPISAIRPFLSKKAQSEPTRFRVEFDADWLTPGKTRELFRYELSVGREALGQPNFILREALFYFPKGRPRRLFERGAPGEAIYVSPEFKLKSKDPRLDAVRADASVIATLAVLNVPLAKRIAEELERGFLWTNITYQGNWQPSTEMVMNLYDNADDMKSWMERQMQRSDLAIQDVDIRIDGTKKQAFFSHHGLDDAVPLPFESSGTKRLFHIMPQIQFALDSGDPVILDEIDGDLHVDIVNEIIHWFHARETNPYHAQLLVTAHNVGVLDDLEKEELFIVEKGPDSATRVHAAQDVSGLRRDTRLYPKYRAGVLGGIPKIG